jgi:hypothetical protein
MALVFCYSTFCLYIADCVVAQPYTDIPTDSGGEDFVESDATWGENGGVGCQFIRYIGDFVKASLARRV